MQLLTFLFSPNDCDKETEITLKNLTENYNFL